MLQETKFQLPSATDPLSVTERGLEILNNPWLNKGTSFNDEERETLGLKGLLPPFRADLEEQVQRVMGNYWRHTDPLDKYTFLIGLADRTRTLRRGYCEPDHFHDRRWSVRCCGAGRFNRPGR